MQEYNLAISQKITHYLTSVKLKQNARLYSSFFTTNYTLFNCYTFHPKGKTIALPFHPKLHIIKLL